MDNDKLERSVWSKRKSLTVLALLVLAASLFWVLWVTLVAPRVAAWLGRAGGGPALQDLGLAGDSFGGLNAFMTSVAGALVLWAGLLQQNALQHAKDQAKAEREHREVTRFEDHFFQLLAHFSSVVGQIERKLDAKHGGPKRGSAALNSFAATVYATNLPSTYDSSDYLDGLKMLVERACTVYEQRPSMLGPFFRMVIEIFSHIDEFGDASDEAERRKLANVARVQISDGAWLLIALFALTPDGYRLMPLIEKYGLLRFMHAR